jgi:hypothetical protein
MGPPASGKKPQAKELVHEFGPDRPTDHAGLITAAETDQHDQARTDLAQHAPLNADGRLAHPLQDRAHQAGPSE